MAIESGLGQAALLASQCARDSRARQFPCRLVVTGSAVAREARGVRTQTCIVADQVGFAGLAQSLTGLHDPVQLGQWQLQYQQHAQFTFVENGRGEKLAGHAAGGIHCQVTDFRLAFVHGRARQTAEGGITPGRLVQVLLIVGAAQQAEQHLAVARDQLEFALAVGLGEVFKDGPVIVGGANKGGALQAGVAGREVAGQGADLVVACLPAIQ